MKVPLFLSTSPHLLPNWAEAFPQALHAHEVPERCDVSIIFLDVQGLSQPDQESRLKQSLATECKVFVLSPSPTEREAVEMIKAGAVGYGHTYCAPIRLQKMASVVDNGGLWLGSQLFKRVMSALNRPEVLRNDVTENPAGFDTLLTPREADVARCVANGATNAEIAILLNVTERTIKGYITTIFEKLNVRNRVELALLLHNVRILNNPIKKSSNNQYFSTK